uniref:Ubiquinone biosynthesis protein n=1 Tax=Cyanothece sp. (strain PCC 7425 / ATCC 29141) TaxID=395961 RepID=B8HY81_CYAP4
MKLFNPKRNLKLIQAARGVFGLIKDPGSLESIFDIGEGLQESEVMKGAIAHLLSMPEVAAIVEERYLGPAPNLEELLQLPPESLGYAYASKMTAENFDPEFYRKVQITSDASYVLLRVRQTHDIWHAVTGFDTDPAGEIGLQAFVLAQNHWPIAILILVGAMLNAVKQQDDLNGLMQLIHRGYQMGVNAKPLLAQKWEEQWERPLAEIRSELNVVPLAFPTA